MPLTATSIDKIKAPPTRLEISDRDGLFLVVQSSGAKSWAFRYRSPVDGKHRKLTIGPYPAFGLADAREQASAARKNAQRGIDPVDALKVAKAKARDRSNIVADQLDDYLKKYDAEHKASSAAEVRRLFDKWVRPAIGKKRVQDVILLVVKLIPASLMVEFRAEAERRDKPVSRSGLAFIVVIWLASLVLVCWWAWSRLAP